MNPDKLTMDEMSQILNDEWVDNIFCADEIQHEIDQILFCEWESLRFHGEYVERLTMYALFNHLIAKFHTQILDSPNLCKLGFVHYGFSENDLEVRLFFLLLDKNVPLEARKLTYLNKNFTPYTLAVSVYIKIFGTEKLPNEYESILLKQTGLIVDVLVQEEIIQLDVRGKIHKEKCRDFFSALSNIIQLYGTEILLNTNKMYVVFKDIAEPDIYNDMTYFLSILKELNKGEADFSREPNKYYLEMLREIIENQNKQYEPLTKGYNTFKKKKEQERKQEEELERQETMIIWDNFLKNMRQEELKQQKIYLKEQYEQEWRKKELQTKIIKIIFFVILLPLVLYLLNLLKSFLYNDVFILMIIVSIIIAIFLLIDGG